VRRSRPDSRGVTPMGKEPGTGSVVNESRDISIV
jgi:hypothetical protein